jgi:pimeloyl-ACP methyl ester carboxylesterase
MPFFKRGDVEIYYAVHGQATPLMFFCETACDCEVWKIHQVPEFARDHMVVTQDYRGTGRSSKPTSQYTTADFVDDAIAILDHLNAGPAIVWRTNEPFWAATPRGSSNYNHTIRNGEVP